MSRIPLVAIALLLLAFPGAASAAERFASPTGSGDITQCLVAAPCSLVDALSNVHLTNGDVVTLAPGTYTVSSELMVVKSVIVRGTGDASATVVNSNGTLNGIIVNDANAELRSFELRHNSGDSAGVVLHSGTVERMIIRSSSGSACEYNAGMIRDTVCHSSASGFSGVMMNMGDNGIHTLLLRNVTAIGSGAIASYGIMGYADGMTQITLYGGSVIAHGTTADVRAAAADTADVTMIFEFSNYLNRSFGGSSTTAITDPTTNSNQTSAPLFVNAAAGDYRQAAGSPTVDAGKHDGSSGMFDFENQARPNGVENDIGADEFHAPPAPPLPAPGDTTAPNGKIVKKPKKRTSKRSARFTFSSDEPGSTFLCKLDKGKYTACKSPFKKKVKRGKHTLKVIAVDAAGNRDATPAVFKWRVTSG